MAAKTKSRAKKVYKKFPIVHTTGAEFDAAYGFTEAEKRYAEALVRKVLGPKKRTTRSAVRSANQPRRASK